MDKPFEKAYALAVRYLARRARSRLEMRHYLAKKSLEDALVDEVIDTLSRDGYLDDRSFARQFIENRIRFKPKSRYALGYELKAKGIDDAIIEELLASYEDFDLAVRAVEQRREQWQRLDGDDRKKKMMNYLRYRGFDYGTCMAVWESLFPQF